MKKILIVVFLASITVSTYALENSDHRMCLTPGKTVASGFVKQNGFVLVFPAVRSFLCTVTVTGQIGVGSTNISVSCAASASTCGAAADQAVGCVKSTVKAVRAIL